MIFENTWQGETVLHEAFIDDNADVSIAIFKQRD